MADGVKPQEPLEPDVLEQAEAAAEEVGGEGARRFVTDAVRKAFLAGVGALFLTEEGARKLAREWKLPKEVLGFVTSQAAGAKDEVMRVVSDEVRKFFQSESLRSEFVKLLGSMSVEIHAEIRLKDAGKGRLEPRVHKATVKPRAERRPEPGPDEGA
jgi:hypothetical protein